jgi:RNA:NAD 2'-phosphotransferase (TPT1/KptA family)
MRRKTSQEVRRSGATFFQNAKGIFLAERVSPELMISCEASSWSPA